ncbi:type VI secretion system-associated protein TagF [Rhizobium sp. P32RR-XVIII]|uniref:type VI secretion system-associated protein TagF n=1 Tax=Rhizobium sp. P32RR-XVIII TaxID=2726738 RepID=UPI001456C1D1|nr:type VI secretion system-associated protein TagF [Rhizobium sp. P32RR-XVIII]NLS07984.1 type VI secretion system-associated protein TagF [Rhizobium sp. P32RR-XVIII]
MNARQASGRSRGFFGKLPSRGDFLHAGLSLDFIQPWDLWLQRVLADGQRMLGETWPEVWRVAPVWRFALPRWQCGPHPVLGLWMPSVDRVGRSFPLTFAAEGADHGDAFLDAAEQVGRTAIGFNLAPEAMMSRLRDASSPEPMMAASARQARWWSTGGPFVAPTELLLDSLPDSVGFDRMLRR